MDVAVQAIARFFREGGFWMYPIITTLAFAVAVSAERAIYYYFRARVNAKALLTEVTRLVRSGEAEKARQLCEKMKSPLAKIVESALWHFIKQETDREIQNAVDEIALRELPRIQRRTHYLSLFANIATLLGLLGTIFGLQAGIRVAGHGRSFAEGIDARPGYRHCAQHHRVRHRRGRVLHDHVLGPRLEGEHDYRRDRRKLGAAA